MHLPENILKWLVNIHVNGEVYNLHLLNKVFNLASISVKGFEWNSNICLPQVTRFGASSQRNLTDLTKTLVQGFPHLKSLQIHCKREIAGIGSNFQIPQSCTELEISSSLIDAFIGNSKVIMLAVGVEEDSSSFSISEVYKISKKLRCLHLHLSGSIKIEVYKEILKQFQEFILSGEKLEALKITTNIYPNFIVKETENFFTKFDSQKFVCGPNFQFIFVDGMGILFITPGVDCLDQFRVSSWFPKEKMGGRQVKILALPGND